MPNGHVDDGPPHGVQRHLADVPVVLRRVRQNHEIQVAQLAAYGEVVDEALCAPLGGVLRERDVHDLREALRRRPPMQRHLLLQPSGP